MSFENLELIRADYEEFRQAGRPPLQRLHPKVEWQTAADLIDVGVLRDRASVGAFVQAYMDVFEGFRLDVVDLIDGGAYVVACVVFAGRIQGSARGDGRRGARIPHARTGARRVGALDVEQWRAMT
jgi:hypothetical protein